MDVITILFFLVELVALPIMAIGCLILTIDWTVKRIRRML